MLWGVTQTTQSHLLRALTLVKKELKEEVKKEKQRE